MSRLTASPFHKPSPFEFPKVPLSPPETNAEMIGPARIPTSYIAGGQEQRSSDMESSPGVASGLESTGSRFRRVSSIAYHTSGIRESPARTPQRSPKAFIIVIPPSTFNREHGQLGHTLSSGPRHRLSQGLLMPLLPTMYGQLTAIAREFNFPSTTGLCLYFHITENGITMTPRISDETWQFIWNHVFEAATPVPTQRSPISGKIEFDIDLSQARWYASWISSSHRDHIEIPFSTNPSAAPSVAHFRGESKSTSVDEHIEEQSQTPIRPPIRPNGIVAPAARHIPRKLSLVDRYDTISIRSGSRRSALSPPEHVQPTSQTLSPIVQEEEPKSARHALDTRVMSWRASAVLNPTPLAATGQTSLEPANMPNMLPIDDTLISTPNQELNLADFTWSISSLGPDEDEPISPMSWDRLPSVHLAHRMQGSVCMTPSDCTSFGPSDYTLPSPAVSIYRLPSPDIAHRMYEDAPPTPSTVTSWGAPLSYPPSPISYPRALSIDLGDRCVFSRPATPSTVTSWGPESWPSSPVSIDRARSIHMDNRGEYSRPVTPSTATSWGAPLSYPSTPSTPYSVHTPDAGQRVFDEYVSSLSWNHKPWGHSWPYTHAASSTAIAVKDSQRHTQGSHSVCASSTYPYLNIYSTVYPHFELYPAPAAARVELPSASPCSDICPAIYPGNLEEIYPAITVNDEPITSVSLAPQYPFFDLYPAVYPHIVPYLPAPADLHPRTYSQGRKAAQYPEFDLYPAYISVNTEGNRRWQEDSCFDLYQAIPVPLKLSSKPKVVIVRMNTYPSFDLYPAVYPAFDIYPTVEYEIKSPRDGDGTGYPYFDLYPAIDSDPKMAVKGSSFHHMEPISVRLDVYPVFDLYPASYPTFNIYPLVDYADGAAKLNGNAVESSVRLSAYPVPDPHPAIYPAFNIYPTVYKEQIGSDNRMGFPQFELLKPSIETEVLSIQLNTYPAFNIYPAVYPFFDIYPVVSYGTTSRKWNDYTYEHPQPDPDSPPLLLEFKATTPSWNTVNLSPKLNTYPVFNLYPTLYPKFDLYPAVDYNYVNQDRKTPEKPIELSVRLHSYPTFDLYPALYPDFDIYPTVQDGSPFKHIRQTGYPQFYPYTPVSQAQSESNRSSYNSVSVQVQASYPIFNLYPSVYPFIDIYPHLPKTDIEALSSYSIYPDFNLYPTVTKHIRPLSQTSGPVKFMHYPTFNLYPPVYPYFDLYPSIPVKTSEGQVSVNLKIDPCYPAFNLYPAVYPHFDLWPYTNQPQMAPFPKPCSRLTHSELHAMVMMEAIGSTGSFRSLTGEFTHRPTKLPKSHHELHHEVFPHGTGSQTPSGTYPGSGPVDSSRVGPRLRQSGLRPPSTRLGLPSSPSPNRGLPAPPTNGSRLSSAFESIPTLVFESGTPYPSRTPPSRTSPIQRFPTSRLPLQATAEHHPSMSVGSNLTRSSSVTAPGPITRPDGLDRSQSLSTTARFAPRRRDSIVLQRVKAYNTSQEITTLSMETLSQFPVPPLPPLPTVARTPKALDRSKYPFA